MVVLLEESQAELLVEMKVAWSVFQLVLHLVGLKVVE
jgi:hypothetical protein